MSKLLVVDDEQSICWGLSRLGESIGHEVVTASSAEQALDSVAEFKPDAIVLDVRLPGMDGLTAISSFRQQVGQVPIIVVTAYGDLNTAVEAVRNGAFEYIIKPFDLDKVERAITRALTSRDNAATAPPPTKPIAGLVGSSPALQEVFKQIALAATSDAGLLLCGESGTGKELAARAIHHYSDRSEGPFVVVNVASLTSTLAESELFGHAKGAFTGADEDRTGLLVQANGGTLFLDEVADIPLPVQVKLLRALDLGEVLPVGSGTPVHTNFRIVSATHQDLDEMVRSGTFRHDLFFRLGAFRIDIPPLRDRRDDIRDLAKHFLGLICRDGEPLPVLSDEVITELERRPWYGNVRELRNAVEHAVIVARSGVIEPDHLPQPAAAVLVDAQDAVPGMDATGDPGDPSNASALSNSLVTLTRRWAESQLSGDAEADDIYEQLLKLVEPPLFQAALEAHQGQCAAAARRLGIHRTTLRKKLNQYDISEE